MIVLYKIGVSLLPVLGFLGTLILLDSFKLVPLRNILWTIGIGAVAALVALWLNDVIFAHWRTDLTVFRRYDAPLVEELAKALFPAYLIRWRKVGFLVDAAIVGFAVGAGFAVVENSYYLKVVTTDNPLVWVVRGFGTAALHGASVVVFAVISKALFDRRQGRGWLVFLPGLAAAFALHSAFNHFILPPVFSTLVVLVILPVIIIYTFARSERATRDWLVEGWDADVELLEAISTGDIQETHVGFYLDNLRSHFPPQVVADMLCLMRLHLELAMSAKGMLLAKDAGVHLPADPEVMAKLEELDYLESSIGRTGLLTLAPLLYFSDRDTWQRQLLRA